MEKKYLADEELQAAMDIVFEGDGEQYMSGLFVKNVQNKQNVATFTVQSKGARGIGFAVKAANDEDIGDSYTIALAYARALKEYSECLETYVRRRIDLKLHQRYIASIIREMTTVKLEEPKVKAKKTSKKVRKAKNRKHKGK